MCYSKFHTLNASLSEQKKTEPNLSNSFSYHMYRGIGFSVDNQ